MRFAILGPLEVRVGTAELSLGGPKQRALLAALLLARNEVVSRDRLVDALWGAQAPPTARRSLDSYISRLRRLLGADRVVRRAPGYALRVDPEELDLGRFDRLVADAQRATAAGDAAAAAQALGAALALWRGPALADLLDEPFAALESARLEERRVGALEDRVDAELAVGRGPELVAELEALVRVHPWRERLLGQLMLVLYRAGRQTDALGVYGDARRRLATELGLEPGSQLRELEQRILQHDPGLDAPRLQQAAAREAPRPIAHARARPRGRVLAAAAAFVVATGIAVAIVASARAPSARPGGSESTNRLVGIDLRSDRSAAPIALTGPPAALVVDADSVWAADSGGQTVARISPASGTVVDRIPVAGQPGSLAVGGGAIWAASTLGGTIERIDPAAGVVTQTVRLGADNVAAIAYGRGALWAADTTQRSLVEIDPRTGSVRRTLELDLRPTAVAVGRGAIWVADYNSGSVEQLDPASGRVVATVRAGNGPAALALSASAAWVVNSLDSTVTRIDARTGSVVATLAVGSGPSAVAVGGGSVWAASQYSGEVARIDPRTNQVTATRHVGGRPSALAIGGDRLWVGAGTAGTGHRGGTLRLVSASPIATIDPAFGYVFEPLQFTRLAYDTLFTFEASPGPSGLRLVPDLALSIPAPSDGGRTYTFRVRPGIRYSDGRLLRASHFRRAIERLFRVGSPGADYYSGIDGAAACARRPASCDLSQGIVVDDRASTVTFRLTTPDPDFPYKLTVFGYSAPIPPGTPDRDVGAAAVPGTGPYRIAGRPGGGAEFVRNRFFREWSHAAQPAGNPDRIVWTTVATSVAAVRAVQRGRADWIYGLLPPAQLRELRIGQSGKLHQNPSLLFEFIPLNTNRAPFDDVRARQALNYAIDRARIARLYGGKALAAPNCQTLIPGILGHRAFCPYTRPSTRPGVWTAPDLARARRLVALSGTAGQRIDVWGTTDSIGVPAAVPAYVAGVLRSLGYRTKLHMVPTARITPELRRRIQLSVDGDWLPDYPAPSSYVPQFFGCDGGLSNGYVCDRALDRRMRRAASLELQTPAAAATAWAAIDREIVRQAYWVPTVNLQEPEFVSERLGNYQSNPVWGFIADQAWVR